MPGCTIISTVSSSLPYLTIMLMKYLVCQKASKIGLVSHFPVFIGRCAKMVGGSGLHDSCILEVWWIGFPADLFNQRVRRLHRVLKEKDFIRLVVKSIEAVLLGLFQVTG